MDRAQVAYSLFCGGCMAVLIEFVITGLLLLLAIPTTLAEQVDDDHMRKESIVFELKPHICVGSVDEACEAGIEFYWRLPEPQTVCIAHLGDILFCSEKVEGSEFRAMNIEPECVFSLLSPKSLFAPIERQIKVLYVGQDVRLRRKHPWSIF